MRKMLEHLELKLLGGYSVETEAGHMIQPKVKDIIEIDEGQYNQYIGLLLYDTDLLDVNEGALKSMGIEELSTFDFLLLQSLADKDFKNIVTNALQFFFKQPVHLLDEYGCFYIGELANQNFITNENYDYIRKVLIKMNYLKDMEDEEELEFGNEMAREWYLEMKKAEQNKPKSKPQVNLHSIISALMWRTNKSIDEILNMTVYQLYDGYYRLFLIDDSLGLKQGIYSGTVDGSKIKPNELNWAKVIKFDKD